MKTRWKHLITGLTIFVLCISVCTTIANAAIVWQDNFDDGLLDGWTLFGWESMESPVKIDGNFSAASGMLMALDDDLNIARHDSNVVEGTWSFDIFVPDDDYGFIRVEFMSNGASLGVQGNMSWIAVSAWFYGTEPTFYLLYGLGSSKGLLETIDRTLQGWHHIEVSRNSDGRFLVYFNGTLEANVTSTSVTSSTYLQVVSNNVTGAAIDNLIVSDDKNETPPPLVLIAIVSGVAVVVIMIAIVFLRRR